MWELSKTTKLAGKYSKPERPVKNKEGKPTTEIQEHRNRWVQYFEELLNRPTPLDPPEAAPTRLSTNVTPRTIEETRMSIGQIKSGKTAGPNNTSAEALKSDIEVTVNMFHVLLRRVWEEEQVPLDWK
ncbi:unnamed protein product [Schistosoma curassoni]|uniref:Uncharacterized protein n=1 Tax=Schistosoma curassoni TaxID=6186 RepID=A0A183K2K0_9TREM|nr:unnamed protein product [Schistosoma curassoni]